MPASESQLQQPEEDFQLPLATVWCCGCDSLSPAAAGRRWASCAGPRPVTAELCAGGSRSSRGSPWCSGGGSPVPSPWRNSSWGYTASAGRLRRCPLLPTDLRGSRGGVGYVKLLNANSKDFPSVLGLNKILNGIRFSSRRLWILLIAGAIPPTDPGPGMFPATAAAWAAAAAWAVAACCCICLWHWRRSNTWRDRTNIKLKVTTTDRHQAGPRLEPSWTVGASTLSPERQKDIFLKCHLRVMCGDPCRYLDVSAGVDFVNSISRGSTGLSVQIVALDKHRVVTQAAHPHVPLALTLKLNAFADVKPERGQQWVTGKWNHKRHFIHSGHYNL